MIEMVTKITEAEEAANKLRRDAQQRAAELEAKAVRAGRETVAAARVRAEAETVSLLQAAQAESEAAAAQGIAKAQEENQQLTETASSKLDAAAQLIVERIVKTK